MLLGTLGAIVLGNILAGKGIARDNLPNKVTDGAYVINLDENADIGLHWICLFFNRSEIVYFDSFGVENTP